VTDETGANGPRAIRSLSFVPAHDPERILAAAGAGMDGLCLDLEDLTPTAAKAEARRVFPEVARRLAAAGVAVFARTNPIDPTSSSGGMGGADLEAIVGSELHCVSIPKTSGAVDVVEFCGVLDRVERDAGLEAGRVLVRPIIETAPGVRNAYEIAAASPRVAYMGGVSGGWWGDLSSSLGYLPTPDGRETFYVRSKVLVDVRAAGVPFPIGGGTLGSSDPDDLRAYAVENKVLGYEGFHCAPRPDAVHIVNEVFTPTRAEVDGWLAVLPALEQAERDGLTASDLDGVFYDLAGLAKVRRGLALARRAGVI
jgi:citrate lyase subunit beta/citryl-CoA lyase